MKRLLPQHKPFGRLWTETLSERWKREFRLRRIDARGMEPIRVRVRLLRERRHDRPIPPQ
ncbi:MAG TPA: hypothetical protein VFX38_04345 [Gammaproteobacteria bacterium]|nr:hypothetical protein [Gammaproteobacteria bacterium]